LFQKKKEGKDLSLFVVFFFFAYNMFFFEV